MTFGELVKESMSKQGMKARELANTSGLNEAYISRVISGNIADPTIGKALAIICALNEDIDEFCARLS